MIGPFAKDSSVFEIAGANLINVLQFIQVQIWFRLSHSWNDSCTKIWIDFNHVLDGFSKCLIRIDKVYTVPRVSHQPLYWKLISIHYLLCTDYKGDFNSSVLVWKRIHNMNLQINVRHFLFEIFPSSRIICLIKTILNIDTSFTFQLDDDTHIAIPTYLVTSIDSGFKIVQLATINWI